MGVRILRNLDYWIILASSREGVIWARDQVLELFQTRHCGQPGEARSFSSSVCGLFESQDRLADFPGFADSIEDRKILLNSRRISVLKRAVCEVLEGSVRSPGSSDSFGSRLSSAPEVPPISSSFGVGLCGRVRPSGLGRLLPNRSSVVVRRGSVNRLCVSGVPPSRVDVLVQRV